MVSARWRLCLSRSELKQRTVSWTRVLALQALNLRCNHLSLHCKHLSLSCGVLSRASYGLMYWRHLGLDCTTCKELSSCLLLGRADGLVLVSEAIPPALQG